jgi:mannose/fructose-specific phosphotransferase system component IIA
MVGVLVLTHGSLAAELLRAATTISGAPPERVRALCLDWNAEPDEALETVRRAGAEVAGDEGLLILTDIHGGTPYRVARRLVSPGKVELISGVNLPMVVRLSCRTGDESGPAELAEWIASKGKASICHADPCGE